MSSEACLALLLDGPMQSWGYASRFERRTTALHPTRSGVLGLIAAAVGIDKHAENEASQLARFAVLRMTTMTLPRGDFRGKELPIHRMEDYHTVTGIRRASGKVDKDATVQTYRHYLLDARFGVLIEGPAALLEEVASGLRNPRWGVWLGRKSCLPATPLLAGAVGTRENVWRGLLICTGYTGNESLQQFDHVLEVAPSESGADTMEDAPIGFGRPIGERHAPRWIRRIPKSSIANPPS
ncbi:MAG: type I-E CRISPR-associated protein Cas5/CasD [Verrucomicrobia bacterium]|nr:type I-E CRISPR-associated protein Cas5/CasD [Verrucomicrobiota bacterium]